MHRLRIEAESSKRLAGVVQVSFGSGFRVRVQVGTGGQLEWPSPRSDPTVKPTLSPTPTPPTALKVELPRLRIEASGSPPMPSVPPTPNQAPQEHDEYEGAAQAPLGLFFVAVGAAQAELLLPVAGAAASQGFPPAPLAIRPLTSPLAGEAPT